MELYDKVQDLNFSVGFTNLRHESYVLLGLMENYVNGAIIQWDRIQSTRTDAYRLGKEFEEEIKREHEETDRYLKELREGNTEEFKQLFQKLSEIREEHRHKFEARVDKRKVGNRTLFLDIHFYFICFDKVQNLIEKLADKESNDELSALWSNLKPKFKPYNRARNHLEHIEDRIKPKYTSDMGNLWDNKFTFGGEEFDISYESLEFIRCSYEQVLDILIK